MSLLFLVLLIGCSKSSNEPDAVEPDPPIDKTANLQGTGDSANDILSNTDFDKILIEAAYVTGFRPTQEAMDNFVDFLRLHTFKQNIEVSYKSLDSPNEETLSLQEIADLESEHRTAYNNGKTLAIYIYFADAPAEDDDEDEGLVTLGAVYRNTSMIIHEVTVERLAGRSLLITKADVETATLNHEFGHLFGLVDLGSEMINDHQNPDAANHCNVSGCLMLAELQFTDDQGKGIATSAKKPADNGLRAGCVLSGKTVMNLLTSNVAKGSAAVPGLDSECILDLQGNGGR